LEQHCVAEPDRADARARRLGGAHRRGVGTRSTPRQSADLRGPDWRALARPRLAGLSLLSCRPRRVVAGCAARPGAPPAYRASGGRYAARGDQRAVGRPAGLARLAGYAFAHGLGTWAGRRVATRPADASAYTWGCQA